MGTPYEPPGKDPTGYPGKPPAQPIPTATEPIEAETGDEPKFPLDRPQKEDL